LLLRFGAADHTQEVGGSPERLGRGACVLGGATKLTAPSFEARIKIDGTRWYKGPASCILVGNVGELFAGIEDSPTPAPTTACSTAPIARRSSRSRSTSNPARSRSASCLRDAWKARQSER
jgi:hypothetical protein